MSDLITLNIPITEEQWDAIVDVDFDHTDVVMFHTKHGKEVTFKKCKTGRWIIKPGIGCKCSQCDLDIGNDLDWMEYVNYCPHCGAKMDRNENA